MDGLYLLEGEMLPAIESYDQIATEGFLSDIIGRIFKMSAIGDNESDDMSAPSTFYSTIASRNELFGKAPIKALYKFQIAPVMVDDDKGVISISNINYALLFKRINETYEERSLDKIFYRTYRGKDIKKFNQKKIARGKMKITSLITPVFFALETSILFAELSRKYNDKKYLQISKDIYHKTWLSKADTNVPEKVDLAYGVSMLASKYKLKPHQEEFIRQYPKLKAQLNLRGYYNAFDQGLGKTLTAAVLAMSLHVDKIYVVCPNTLVPNWYNEINDYFEGKVKPYDCKSSAAPAKDVRVFITNNESIKNILPYIDKNCKSMLIVDEGHNFRSINSARVMELIKLREALNPSDVLLMSGTPLKASPNELVPALVLLDPIFTPAAAKIYNTCFNFSNYEAMTIVTTRLGKVIYRKMKSDVLALPSKTIIDMKLKIKDPSPYYMENIRKEVIEAYYQNWPLVVHENFDILNQFCMLVRQYSTAPRNKTEWYLSRICRAADTKNSATIEQMHELDVDQVTTFLQDWVFSNPACSNLTKKTLTEWESKLIHYDKVVMGRAVGQVYPAKRTRLFNALWDENEAMFIDKITSNLKKTVIFSQFAGVSKHISERLTALGIANVRVDGTVVNQKRAENLARFHHDENVQVIVATSQSMGTGVTLIEASQMFFFGAPWRSADYDQCCDRIYRIGQDEPVFIYNILLESKQVNLSDRMDKIMKWSAEMFHSAMDVTIVEESVNTFMLRESFQKIGSSKHQAIIADSINSLFV